MKRQAGMTLIEMLVATAVTLLLVGALTQAFQIVGTNVASNRATLEMAGQIRGVNIRLQSDLANVTVPLKPWPRPSEGLGYFEYIEGWDHDGSPYLLRNTSFGDNDDVLMFTARSNAELFLGLYTDYTAATPTPTTITSPLAEIAWWATLTDKAVVDTNADGLMDTGNGSVDPDQGEDFTLYRRVLLIRPDLWSDLNGNLVKDPSESGVVAVFPNSGTYNITSQADLKSLRDDLLTFYGENDISVRIVRTFLPAGSSNLQVKMVANSLEDLTKRENRFAHSRIVADNPSAAPWTPGVPPPGRQRVALRYYSATFPHHLDRDYTSATALPTLRVPKPDDYPFEEPGLIKSGLYQGEDVIMSHAAAFDVRAYDPMAVVAAYPGEDGVWGAPGDDDGVGGPDDVGEAGWPGTDDEAVFPGDPGFALPGTLGSVRLVADPSSGNVIRTMAPIGRGAFVDLYYTMKLHIDGAGDYSYNGIDGLSGGTALPNPPHVTSLVTFTTSASETNSTPSGLYYSHFSGAPLVAAAGTGNVGIWPTLSTIAQQLPTYDTWSFHYEADGVDQDNDSTTDEGTDGLDNDGANGVDDEGERETNPPYPIPLRAIQVRIRMVEHNSRQVRQVTVESDFTPE